MNRKFSPKEKPLALSHCPNCDASSRRLCDMNPLSNETIFVSPFTYFESGNERLKICRDCGYEVKEIKTLGDIEKLK